MKLLYAIQGTGNGHLSRSLEIVPLLQQMADVDILISGTQVDLQLPFPVKYRFNGFGFIFGKSGGVDIWKTFYKASFRKFLKEVNKVPVEEYDLVINDFEPVSAWACYVKNKPCIGLSHQAAVLSEDVPKPDESDMIGKLILKNYAPTTSQYGFHFRRFDENIFTPVIRKQVREQKITDKGHYTVYLPAYDDKRLIERLSEFKDVEWDVFSKHNKRVSKHKNVSIQPINNEKFVKSVAQSAGVLCGAGFETPAEALFLGKKLLVIPMKGQYEQQLNAAALKAMGVPVIKSLKPKHNETIQNWLESGKVIGVDYPDNTKQVLELVINRHYHPVTSAPLMQRV
ncbi:glycosyltransferase family protein [Mucilaginibacter ginsenosidivorans]|uniref:Glycosyl transferase n=1 Tax=Mucilaginibacter ginsenosidivorans TaxID=398053 RepID=A0A5B8V035_9SPHI|nr:glycosyltransferase family protein [Mucilaginibacter ginsenosidivorans]QEC64599.1 glycosyl transferase [Mucilaginibacter ginsenosidivorans]